MHALAPRGVGGPARGDGEHARAHARHARPPTPANTRARAGPQTVPLVCVLLELVLRLRACACWCSCWCLCVLVCADSCLLVIGGVLMRDVLSCSVLKQVMFVRFDSDFASLLDSKRLEHEVAVNAALRSGRKVSRTELRVVRDGFSDVGVALEWVTEVDPPYEV